ncbi:tRNA lysidine(34) synthetase TilS [Sphingorhabdus lutea]|uniref:tRNA(Ile)-lysidine synthase n=1 Tax=Sphingorhabdus lutea TaxID=1913578 RepID=A0A1L3JB23_9SPHN|nr:tRNA lysidine(34) synthetase TilS [Sphingorhabdus lutea]APG62337.1 tRNA lysidine(34) synthetase TilS [Sphingorhabdus lutea]
MPKILIKPEISQKFLKNIVQLIPILGQDNNKLLIAVSGGPDSLALMLLAQHHFTGNVMAATIDHQLRSEAAQEADYVAQICSQIGMPHFIEKITVSRNANIQSSARAERYKALHRIADAQNGQWILTAHHADDQLETMMMRLARGSGIDGLSGVRPQNGNIIRPLLNFTKDELQQICDDAAIAPIIDPSNQNVDFDRVRFRNWLSQPQTPINAISAAQSAHALQQANDAISWSSDILWAQHHAQSNDIIMLKNMEKLPHIYQRRLVLRAISCIENDVKIRGEQLSMIIENLLSMKKATIGDIIYYNKQSVWTFETAPKRAPRPQKN